MANGADAVFFGGPAAAAAGEGEGEGEVPAAVKAAAAAGGVVLCNFNQLFKVPPRSRALIRSRGALGPAFGCGCAPAWSGGGGDVTAGRGCTGISMIGV